MLLGQRIDGSGFQEAAQAVDLIVAQPACARFVATRLATYFVADTPPPALVDKLSRVFQRTHGDLAAVVEALFTSQELLQSAGRKFRDPMQYVVGSLRLAYQGRTLVNLQPAIGWLNSLGEVPFGRTTPDGYPLVASAWSRFRTDEPSLRDRARHRQRQRRTVPVGECRARHATRRLSTAGDPSLLRGDRTAPGRGYACGTGAAASQAEWNTYLLSSPELNYR